MQRPISSNVSRITNGKTPGPEQPSAQCEARERSCLDTRPSLSSALFQTYVRCYTHLRSGTSFNYQTIVNKSIIESTKQLMIYTVTLNKIT